MGKRFLRWFFGDWTAVVFMLAGSILLVLTLKFRVNPVEVTVVDDAIAGTNFHLFLLVTTMPAWIAGLVLGLGSFLSFPLMFVFQIIIFGLLGKAVTGLILLVRRKGKLSQSPYSLTLIPTMLMFL